MSASLSDSFKRKIDYLRISVTDRCNLKCIYCRPDNDLRYFRESEILKAAEITRFVKVAHKHGLMKVRLTGGEPLMRKDIINLVSSIKDIGIRDLSITTNGIMLADMAEPLKEAGVDRVNISLDTLNAGKFKDITRGGDIHRIWEAIERAESIGLSPIKINVVPIRGINDGEILEFASLTFEKDYHIRFIEFMPIGHGRICKEGASVKNEELKEKISSLGELNCLEFKGRGPSRNYRIRGAKGIIGFISPMSDCFCDFCNRLRLTAHGKIRPCLASDVEVDIKTPMRDGISDEGLEGLLFEAVAVKPAGRYLNGDRKFSSGLPSMSKIGG
jgi:cyclic pyranopterin phosphate synthase